MARWQKTSRRSRRRRGLPQLVALSLILVGAAIAIRWWLLVQQPTPTQSGASADLDQSERSRTTPEFYGTPSALIHFRDGVTARLVDRPDSSGPLALILTAPDDVAENWAGVQATLERFGVGSLVVPPRSGGAAARDAAELLLAAARRRSQPLAIIAADAAIDLAVTIGGESSLADRPLVVLAPSPRLHSGLDALIARLPPWLRRRLLGGDARLATWRGRLLVVRAKEDARFDAVAANALVAGAPGARILVVPGSGFRHAPAHPDQESWRAIADFIRGVVRAREEITVEPEPLPSDSTPTPPAGSQPPPPRSRPTGSALVPAPA